MPEMTSYPPGTPCWVDLGTPDIDRAVDFYGSLLGWNVPSSENPEQTGGYRIGEIGGKPVAGLMPLMQEGQPPEGFPPAELLALHDPGAEKSLVVVILENEDNYKKADEMLSAMPAGDTPGQRTSVTKYNVAMRMKQ